MPSLQIWSPVTAHKESTSEHFSKWNNESMCFSFLSLSSQKIKIFFLKKTWDMISKCFKFLNEPWTGQQLPVAYPCALLYGVFVLISVFELKWSGMCTSPGQIHKKDFELWHRTSKLPQRSPHTGPPLDLCDNGSKDVPFVHFYRLWTLYCIYLQSD